MGAWGARIYEDDTALDVRGDFMDMLYGDLGIKTIEANIHEMYIEDDSQENNDIVLLALCCAELETGTLTEHTKKAALEVIDSGRQYDVWLKEAGKDDAALRKRELTLIRKYIDNYNGKPVKRRSWLELQKEQDEDEAEGWAPGPEYEGVVDEVSKHVPNVTARSNEDGIHMLAGAHLASLVYWLITRGYYLPASEKDTQAMAEVREGKLDADIFLIDHMGSKLRFSNIHPDIHDFIYAYYPEPYVYDYAANALKKGQEIYGAVPERGMQERVAHAIDKRLVAYRHNPGTLKTSKLGSLAFWLPIIKRKLKRLIAC
jgi:hypothetical protein